MAVYRTNSPIAATAEAVWGILIDFERWQEWNPSIPSISGEAQLGSTLKLTLAMSGRLSAKVEAKLTEVVPERRSLPAPASSNSMRSRMAPCFSRTSKMSPGCYFLCSTR